MPSTLSGRAFLRFLLLGWCVLGGGKQAHAQQPPLVEPRTSHPIALIDDGAHEEVFIPLRRTGQVPIEQLQAYVAAVELNQTVRPSLSDAFTVGTRPANPQTQGQRPGPSPEGLWVKVDFAQVSSPGSYDVKVVLLARREEAGAQGQGQEQSQELSLQFHHAEAQLRSISSLIIHRELPGGSEFVVPSTLELDNTSDGSRLSDLSVTQVGTARLGTQPVSGRLKIVPTSDPWILGPRGHAAPAIKLEGEFPAGTVTGSLEIRAPQLKAPVVIPFEVHSRLPGWWIILIFFLGALSGWLYRNWLKQRQDVLTLKSQAEVLVAQIDRELETNPFTEQTQALGAHRTNLEQAMEAEDSKLLTPAVQAASGALSQVATERAQARNKLFADLSANLTAVTLQWELPPEVSLGTLAATLDAARQKLVMDDLRGANELQNQARKALDTLARDGATWARTLRTQLSQPIQQLPTAAVTEDVKQALAEAIQALEAVPEEVVTPPPSTEERLKRLHEAQGRGRVLIDRLLAGMLQETEAAAKLLEREPFMLIEQARALRDQARKLVQEAPGQKRITEALSFLREGFFALEATVRRIIEEQLTDKPTELAAVQTILSEGRLADAITQTVGILRAAPPSGRTKIGSTTPSLVIESPSQVMDLASAVEAARSSRARPGPEVPRQMGVLFMGGGMQTLQAVHARTLRSLLGTRLARGLISAALLSVAAYVVAEAGFIGTFPEIFGLFVTAFVTDFTVESVLDERLGSFKKP